MQLNLSCYIYIALYPCGRYQTLRAAPKGISHSLMESIYNLLVLSLVFPSVCFDKESCFYLHLSIGQTFCRLHTKMLGTLHTYTAENTKQTQTIINLLSNMLMVWDSEFKKYKKSSI